jgi:hypothetical protein
VPVTVEGQAPSPVEGQIKELTEVHPDLLYITV